MIKKEYFGNFVRTYSDAGFKIQSDSGLYSEAIDLVTNEKEYVETDIPIVIFDEDADLE